MYNQAHRLIAAVLIALAGFLAVDDVAEGADTLRIEKTDRVGRKIENEYFIADLSHRTIQGKEEDSGTLRALTYKKFGVTLRGAAPGTVPYTHLKTDLTIRAIQSDKPAQAFKIEDLSWLSGDWETAPGRMQIDEHWTKVAGGSLIGMSRTVAGGKTVFFEYLRIEARGADIYYVAYPKARTPGTDFKLARLTGQEAVFENPAHDFPKRVIYRKNGDGTLTARIEGDGSEKEKQQEFHYRPIPRAN